MNRRTTVSLILLLLLLLLLVAQALMRPPRRVVIRAPKSAGRELSLEATRTLLDEGLGEIPETEGESAPEEPKPIISILNHSGWLNKGSYEVFGTIQNTGQLTGRDVSMYVIFKDPNFVTLAEVQMPADRSILRPGEKSGFKVWLNDKSKSSFVGSYVVLPQVRR